MNQNKIFNKNIKSYDLNNIFGLIFKLKMVRFLNEIKFRDHYWGGGVKN
jgi:hypothetical protein